MDPGSELLASVRRAGSGLAGIGVCDASPFAGTRRDLEAALAAGRHATLGFTYADPGRATDIRASFPWAERLVVGAWSYLPAAGDPGPPAPATGRVARFATADHYEGLRSQLGDLAAVLRGAGHRAEVLVDDSRLVDRAAAIRSGIGWWGKNTMVLAPGSGPWLLLGSVVTDAPLPVSVPQDRTCGTCSACIPACPTGALVEPGVLDARLCLAHWAQAPGVFPAELREPMGDRVYGCDDCLDACPPGARLAQASRGRAGRIDLIGLLATDDRTLLARYDHWYVPRRDARYLRRNALIALGNAGGSKAVGVVAGYLGHPDWLLRAHAAWALGRLGGPFAAAALDAAAAREDQVEVLTEIAAARGTLS